jgi:hypothetical protein
MQFLSVLFNYAASCLDYIASVIKRMTMEYRSNDTDTVQPKCSEEPATFSTTNPTWTGLEVNPC